MDKPTISLIRSQCYVDGQWTGEPKLPVTNKATGDVITKVPSLGEAETRSAIEAANRASTRCTPGTLPILLQRSGETACCARLGFFLFRATP